MTDHFRVYAPEECGQDGYPFAWHRIAVDELGVGVLTERRYGIKDLVREQAGHRCVRCGHPYLSGANGNGEWSPCDDRCEHSVPIRIIPADGQAPITFLLPESRMHMALAMVEGRTEAQWRILTVHHLNGDKADCRWWNLVSLCQRCHLTIQGRVVMGRVWPWEHSDWFKPYVAGYYASVYLGEELGREEVSGRLEELLALEQVA